MIPERVLGPKQKNRKRGPMMHVALFRLTLPHLALEHLIMIDLAKMNLAPLSSFIDRYHQFVNFLPFFELFDPLL